MTGKKLLFIWLVATTFFYHNELNAQCCGVGGGNPMAGDASRGVLKQGKPSWPCITNSRVRISS